MSRRKSTRAQEHKMIGTLAACALMSCVLFCRVSANTEANNLQKDSVLKLYLPREVTIKNDTISLGEVSIIGGNPSKGGLAAKAIKIPLGRITMPGQEIVIDRSMILSRLACNGIPASKVILTGAEKITVRQLQKIIKSSEFVELASAFLKKNPPVGSACQWNAIRIPKDLKNQAKVRIAVVQNGKQIAECEVTFRLKYNCRRAVTLVDIPAGAVISSKNVKIESAISSHPEAVNWKPPYGLIAKRPLAAKTTLGPYMVIVRRNQNVVIRIERPLLLITAIGKTMQEDAGRAHR
ncbi:MAG: hypothetical protein ACYSU5_18740 [Planctomycetota bacterium]|jgi:flagella basal body P-ring formation protein FlgA